MSKKHYVAIAKIIKSQIKLADFNGETEDSPAIRLTAINIARDFADFASLDNPEFDRARFLAACGVK